MGCSSGDSGCCWCNEFKTSDFRQVTLIEPVYAATDIRTVYIFHIGQMHHVSTCVSSCLNENSFKSQTINSGQKIVLTL